MGYSQQPSSQLSSATQQKASFISMFVVCGNLSTSGGRPGLAELKESLNLKSPSVVWFSENILTPIYISGQTSTRSLVRGPLKPSPPGSNKWTNLIYHDHFEGGKRFRSSDPL